jgi:hypothetical protein
VVGCTTGSREGVPGERKPVTRDENNGGGGGGGSSGSKLKYKNPSTDIQRILSLQGVQDVKRKLASVPKHLPIKS